jgi:hypothetical protein
MKNLKFQFYVGLGLVGLTLYDVFKTAFEMKHAIFLGIAALAIYQGLASKK